MFIIKATGWDRAPEAPIRINFSKGITRGLVSAWRFRPVAWDVFNRKLSLVNGATVSAGSVGQGLKSNNSSTDIQLQSPTSLVAGDFTIRLIVRIDSSLTSFAALFDKSSGANRELIFTLNSTGDINFLTVGGSGPTGTSGSTTLAPSPNVYHVVIARSIASNRLTIYQNGVSVKTYSANCTGTSAFGTYISCGLNPSGGGAAIGATYFEYDVWNRELSAGEAYGLYVRPWEIFEPRRRILRFKPTVGAGAQTVTPSGIASAEAFGTAVITTGAVSIVGAGNIATAEAFGTAVVSVGASLVVGAGNIASAEAFGSATVTPGAVTVSGAGAIATAEAFGTASVTTGVLFVTGAGAIASAEAFGSATVVAGAVIVSGVGAIVSAEAFGTAVVTIGAGLTVSGAGAIASAQAFGNATVVGGAVTVSGVGAIPSAEAFGTALVFQPGLANIASMDFSLSGGSISFTLG